MNERLEIAKEMLKVMIGNFTANPDWFATGAQFSGVAAKDFAREAFVLADALIAEGNKCQDCGQGPGQHKSDCPQVERCSTCGFLLPDHDPECPEVRFEDRGKDIITREVCQDCGQTAAAFEYEKHKEGCPNAVPF